MNHQYRALPTHILMQGEDSVQMEGRPWQSLSMKKSTKLLETTSRSFYPTLKYLPKKTRGQIGLLYLLARVADTIADSKVGETKVLSDLLLAYNEHVQGRNDALPDFTELASLQSNEHEAELLRNVEDVVAWV